MTVNRYFLVNRLIKLLPICFLISILMQDKYNIYIMKILVFSTCSTNSVTNFSINYILSNSKLCNKSQKECEDIMDNS